MKRSGVLPIGWLIRSLNRRYKQKSVSIYTFGAFVAQTNENTAQTRVDDNLSDLTRYLLPDIDHFSRDYAKHYQQLPEIFTKLPLRFIAKIDFLVNGCWLWKGAAGFHPRYREHRYGQYVKWNPLAPKGKRRTMTTAHRFAYECTNGVTVPKGEDIDHLCGNKLCVNPDHLEAVSHQENCRRRELRAKASLQETRVTQ